MHFGGTDTIHVSCSSQYLIKSSCKFAAGENVFWTQFENLWNEKHNDEIRDQLKTFLISQLEHSSSWDMISVC
jgi:hypothetical protein